MTELRDHPDVVAPASVTPPVAVALGAGPVATWTSSAVADGRTAERRTGRSPA